MKKLLITLLLVSPFSFADWGDVYYCKETTHSRTTLAGTRTDYKLEKFQFKLDKAKNAIIFRSKGFLENSVLEPDKVIFFPEIEIWSALGLSSVAYFKEGRFLFAEAQSDGLFSITADCEKF